MIQSQTPNECIVTRSKVNFWAPTNFFHHPRKFAGSWSHLSCHVRNSSCFETRFIMSMRFFLSPEVLWDQPAVLSTSKREKGPTLPREKRIHVMRPRCTSCWLVDDRSPRWWPINMIICRTKTTQKRAEIPPLQSWFVHSGYSNSCLQTYNWTWRGHRHSDNVPRWQTLHRIMNSTLNFGEVL